MMSASENQPGGKEASSEENIPDTQVDPPAGEVVRRPSRRGFAAMDRDRVKEIASKGGKAAHAAGTAHQFNSDEARNAGRKGGMAPHVRRGGVRRRPADGRPADEGKQSQGHDQQSGDSR